MKLEVTSTASSKKGTIYVSTKKIDKGPIPATGEILYCVTEEEYKAVQYERDQPVYDGE